MKRFSNAVIIAAMATFAALFLFCTKKETAESTASDDAENAIYYWKGWVDLDNQQREFLEKHDIDRLYLRFFDVVANYTEGAVPEGNVYISKNEIPNNLSVVPTVFVTVEAIKSMGSEHEELAGKIYKRINAMAKKAEIENIDEIQIDCDWTESTREPFYNLCESLRKLANADGRKLSSTIRLHQLTQPVPPVDSGVLMVYNVGNLKDFNETNSILRADIVNAYLKNAPDYDLPLDVAYPIFQWGVVFNGEQFLRLQRITTSIDSIPGLTLLHDNIYQINADPDEYKYTLSDGPDLLRFENVSPKTLGEVKKAVEKYLGGRPHRVILYHLDENLIDKYTDKEIAKIYE